MVPDLGICPKILGNGPGPWDLGKWEDDLGIWAQAAPIVMLALNKMKKKTGKILTLITNNFWAYFCLKTHRILLEPIRSQELRLADASV